MSATSDYQVGGMKSDYSATSISATSDLFKKSKKIQDNSTLSKMDLIRQKIRDLDSSSESNIFQKNKVIQSGGANKNIIGINSNSSSTSSLCE